MKKIIKVVSFILSFLQILLFLGVFYIENLAYKRAGVNHHLVFVKNKYMKSYFSTNNLKIILIISMIIFFVFLFKIVNDNFKGKKINFYLFIPIIWTLMNFMLIVFINIKKVYAYPFFIIILLVNIVISILVYLLNKILVRESIS